MRPRMPVSNRLLLLIALLALPIAVWAQNPTEIEEERDPAAAKEPTKGFKFEFDERPSFRYGDDIRLDIKTKWHFDFRHFYPRTANPPETTDTFILQRARFGLKGKVTKWLDYEIEREMHATFGDENERHPWKDVYVDFQPFSFVRL